MSAAAIPSNAPSTEYRRHHRVEAPAVDQWEYRPGWRVKTGLDGLLEKGLINGPEYHRALRFRRSYEAAHRGAMGGSTWGKVFTDPHCRRPQPEPTERELDAVARVRMVERSLGGLYGLLVLVVVADARWAEIGRRFAVDPKTAKTWCAAAVAALAAL
jgi:hypothetical protein